MSINKKEIELDNPLWVICAGFFKLIYGLLNLIIKIPLIFTLLVISTPFLIMFTAAQSKGDSRADDYLTFITAGIWDFGWWD